MAKKRHSCPRQSKEPRFPLGQICATPAALDALTPEDIQTALGRHVRGDWGDVCREDKDFNEMALLSGTRLLSSYQNQAGRKFWIITEADRSLTTVLLPEDY